MLLQIKAQLATHAQSDSKLSKGVSHRDLIQQELDRISLISQEAEEYGWEKITMVRVVGRAEVETEAD